METKRESRYVRVARLAYQLAQATLPTYSHAKSPHRFTLPQRAACVLVMFYLDLSYRDMEEWLLASEQVCRVLELRQIPDHSTLSRTYKKLKLADWQRMQTALLDQMGVAESLIACDSTGFSPTQASSYFQTRSGRTWRSYIKGVYAVGTQSLLVLAARSAQGPGNDVVYLNGMRRRVKRYGRYVRRRRHWLFLADAGFDGRTVQPGDLIPPIRRHGKLVDPSRQARADLVAAARLDGIYGQRWQVETVNSVIKRRFGQAIRSRLKRLQLREPVLKALVYNLHVCYVLIWHYCLYQRRPLLT